jgi:hypothetical protein
VLIYATAVVYFFYVPRNYLLVGAILFCRRADVNKSTRQAGGRA